MSVYVDGFVALAMTGPPMSHLTPMSMRFFGKRCSGSASKRSSGSEAGASVPALHSPTLTEEAS